MNQNNSDITPTTPRWPLGTFDTIKDRATLAAVTLLDSLEGGSGDYVSPALVECAIYAARQLRSEAAKFAKLRGDNQEASELFLTERHLRNCGPLAVGTPSNLTN
jgi:hypothetical protein